MKRKDEVMMKFVKTLLAEADIDVFDGHTDISEHYDLLTQRLRASLIARLPAIFEERVVRNGEVHEHYKICPFMRSRKECVDCYYAEFGMKPLGEEAKK